MQDTESNNPFVETLNTQFETVKANTLGSPVQKFGDFDFVDEVVAEFQGNFDGSQTLIERSFASFLSYVNPAKPQVSKSKVDSRDVKMHYLYKRAERNGGEVAQRELIEELESRMDADSLFNKVFAHHAEANELVVVP